MNGAADKDLFSTATDNTANPPLVLELKGIEVHYKVKQEMRTLKGIPGFKNTKRMWTWIDKAGLVVQWVQGHWWMRKDTVKLKSMLFTENQYQTWMDLATHSLELQLRSALQITEQKIRTVACPRSWIASRVPLDDSWHWCPEIILRSEKCEAGQEGAVIVIERIR